MTKSVDNTSTIMEEEWRHSLRDRLFPDECSDYSTDMESEPPGSSGSSVAPEGDGNTESPSGAEEQGKRGAGKRHWGPITIQWAHGSTGSKLQEVHKWIQEHCTAATYQIERAQTGQLHLQLALSLKKKQRFEWLKRHFMPEAHLEVSRAVEKAHDYCQKEESRVEGPWFWPPRATTNIKDPLQDIELYQWQQEIKEIITQEPDQRKIYWYWEPDGGAGKTTFARHIALQHDIAYFIKAKESDIYHNYKGQRIIIFNLNSQINIERLNYGIFETLKDGILYSGKYEGKTLVFDYPHIFVFANSPPNTTLNNRIQVQRVGQQQP